MISGLRLISAIMYPLRDIEDRVPDNHPLKTKVNKKEVLKFLFQLTWKSILFTMGLIIILNSYIYTFRKGIWWNLIIFIFLFMFILLTFVESFAYYYFSMYFGEAPRRLSYLEMYNYSKQIFYDVMNKNKFDDFYLASKDKLAILSLEYKSKYEFKSRKLVTLLKWIFIIIPLGVVISQFIFGVSDYLILLLILAFGISAIGKDVLDYELLNWKYQIPLKSSLFVSIFKNSGVKDELKLELEKLLLTKNE